MDDGHRVLLLIGGIGIVKVLEHVDEGKKSNLSSCRIRWVQAQQGKPLLCFDGGQVIIGLVGVHHLAL